MDRALSKLDEKKIQSWRIRTIIYSIIASGLVTLTLANIDDARRYNRSVDENRRGCQAIYGDREVLKSIAEEVSRVSTNPEVRERWSRYADTFRRRLPPYLKECDELYKKRGYIPFIE